MSKVTLDRAGRVVLPKNLRDELHLSPGDTLDVTVQGDEVMLRPRRSSSPLQKKQGVWVFSTGKPMTSDETAEALRDMREQRRAPAPPAELRSFCPLPEKRRELRPAQPRRSLR